MYRKTGVHNYTHGMLEMKVHKETSEHGVFSKKPIKVDSGLHERIPSSRFKNYNKLSLTASQIFIFIAGVQYMHTLMPQDFITYSKLTFHLEGDRLTVMGVIAKWWLDFFFKNNRNPILVLETTACVCASVSRVQSNSTLAEDNHTDVCASVPRVQSNSTLAEDNHTDVPRVQSKSTLAKDNHTDVCASVPCVQSKSTLAEDNHTDVPRGQSKSTLAEDNHTDVSRVQSESTLGEDNHTDGFLAQNAGAGLMDSSDHVWLLSTS